MSGLVGVEVSPAGVADVHMRDREGRNILREVFVRSLLDALDAVDRDPRVKVAVLRGLDDVFCGGGEKDTLLGLCEGRVTTQDLLVSEKLLDVHVPVVAAMEGHAMGGGLVMAACCDLAVAARESRYGAVFMTMGFTPGMGCTTLLELLVGPFVASEMMFTGRRFRGSQLAERSTNINYIVPRTQVLPRARDLGSQVAEQNVRPLRLLKHALAARKKELLVRARLQEDLMHQLSFSFPETRATIEERYVE
jgi:polyketide biosynthesis enoyl-CoA hydratase PksI